MLSFGLCSRHKDYDSLSYESRALIEEAEKLFDEVLLIDTRRVNYLFIEGEKRPFVFYQGKDISNLNSLHARSTVKRETSTSLLVHSLDLCGCNIFDPLKRFPVGYSSKLLTSIKRFEQGVGPSTFFSFEFESAINLINDIAQKSLFPLIAKPVAGKQGRGINLLTEIDNAVDFVSKFFSMRENPEEPFFLQTYIQFAAEYRALVVNGDVLGIVQKHIKAGEVAANAAQGTVFAKVIHPELADFLVKHISAEGVLGVDVGINNEGKFYILEHNRAPMWHQFESATGINVAKIIVKHSFDSVKT
jgi:hypothetical protein